MTDIAVDKLRSLVQGLVTLEEEKAEAQANIKAAYDQARSAGYDTKAVRAVVKEKMEDEAKRRKRAEHESILDTYRNALGLLAELPLGEAALRRVA